MMTVPDLIVKIAMAVQAAGGRALCVGGWVRDFFLGQTTCDWDMEIYHLSPPKLEAVLQPFGPLIYVGKIYGIYRLMNHHIDISIPREDHSIGPGHKDVHVTLNPDLPFEVAFKRRDLTMNSMGYDPLTHTLIDPYNGRGDIQHKILKATDPITFTQDPLRALRVAQMAARFHMTASPELVQLCRSMDLSSLSAERYWGEFEKLLLHSTAPSVGLLFMESAGLLRFFPPLSTLVGTPQEAKWHPEGDVWTHTLMVVDAAAGLRTGDGDHDLTLMFSALCHDLGKPESTHMKDGRTVSYGHEVAGVKPTGLLMDQIRAGHDLKCKVQKLVRWHLAPLSLILQKSSAAAFYRLARDLNTAGLTLKHLYALALADHQGRGHNAYTQENLLQLPLFKDKALELGIWEKVPLPKITGQMLMERGICPGPEMGRLLKRCEQIQDDHPLAAPEDILKRALGEAPLTPDRAQETKSD